MVVFFSRATRISTARRTVFAITKVSVPAACLSATNSATPSGSRQLTGARFTSFSAFHRIFTVSFFRSSPSNSITLAGPPPKSTVSIQVGSTVAEIQHDCVVPKTPNFSRNAASCVEVASPSPSNCTSSMTQRQSLLSSAKSTGQRNGLRAYPRFSARLSRISCVPTIMASSSGLSLASLSSLPPINR